MAELALLSEGNGCSRLKNVSGTTFRFWFAPGQLPRDRVRLLSACENRGLTPDGWAREPVSDAFSGNGSAVRCLNLVCFNCCVELLESIFGSALWKRRWLRSAESRRIAFVLGWTVFCCVKHVLS